MARRDKDARFTALLHQVSVPRLMLAFEDLNPRAAPGVDGVTWQEYGRDLVANLRDLHGRVQSGRYRASPSRRVYIPRADGRQRPLGIAALEDKIVQRAVTGVLNADRQVAGRGGHRRRAVVGDRAGITAGGIGIAAARQRVPALRPGPVG